MTLLFMDGFDTADMLSKYTTASGDMTTVDTTRYGFGRCWRMHPTGSAGKINFTASPKIFMGFAYVLQTSQTSTSSMPILWADGGSVAHLSMRVNSDQSIRLLRGDGGTLLATSAADVITYGMSENWNYIEISATIHDSTGEVVIKVDGVTVIDFSGDTRNGGTSTDIDAVTIQRGSEGTYTWVDDLYICNEIGSYNNGFLGDVRVSTLVPTGAGDSTQFTPLSGNNWDNVNDLPYNPATYNSDGVSGHRDSFVMSDLSAGYNILAVQGNVVAKMSDAGAVSIMNAVKSGGTVYYGPPKALESNLKNATTVWETDPDTAIAWVDSDLNASEFGVEVV